MPVADLEDCKIYYEEHGSGYPLLMISGLGGVGSYWNPQLPVFSEQFRVITHDHRGTGQSSRSYTSYSVEQMTSDVIGLMDHLGVERAHVVGHSTGGAIAQVLATEHPQRVNRMVLYATWTKADAFFRRCFEVRLELLRKAGAQAYIRGASVFLYPSWWIRSQGALADAEDSSVYGADFDAEIVERRINALLEFDRTDQLGSIRAPCLVVGVANDHLTPAYYSVELAERIPAAELVILEDGAHVASEVKSDEFNRVVMRFLLREFDGSGLAVSGGA